MPFDPSTAALLEEDRPSGFDPSTATLIEDESPSIRETISKEFKSLPEPIQRLTGPGTTWKTPAVEVSPFWTTPPWVPAAKLMGHPQIAEAGEAMAQETAQTISGFTSPENLAMIAATKAVPPLGVFMAARMIPEAYESGKQAVKSMVEGDIPGAVRGGTRAALTGTMALLGGLSPFHEKILPKATAEAVKKAPPVIPPESPKPAGPPPGTTKTRTGTVTVERSDVAPDIKVKPAPTPAATPPVAPPKPQESSGRTRQSIAAQILKRFGVNNELADRFGNWIAPRIQESGLEGFRDAVLKTFQSAGMQSEREISMFHTEPSYYEAMGFTPEQVAEHIRNAEYANEKAMRDTRAENARRMEELEAGRIGETKAPTQAEPLSQADVDRIFLDKLNEESNLEIEQATATPKPAALTPDEQAEIRADLAAEMGEEAPKPTPTPEPPPMAPEVKAPEPTPPAKVEAPAATQLTPGDKGITPQEKAFRSTAEGQKAMASRASRIAVLNQMNEAIRKIDPKEAYDRSLIEQTPDSQIDSMMESLRQDYNRLVAKPAAKPVAETGKEMGAPEIAYDSSLEAFRKASREFSKAQKAYRARTIGDQEFLAASKKFKEAEAIADKAERDFIDAKNATGAAITPKEARESEVKRTAPVQAAAKVEQQVKAVAKTEGQRSAKEVKGELVQRLEDAAKESPFNTADYFEGLYVYEARTLSETTRLTDRPVEGTVPLKDWLDRPMTKKDKTPNRDTAMGGRFMQEALERKKVPKVTIEIPGDGTFTIWNTKDALAGLAKRAQKISTTTTPGKGFSESKPTREQGQLWTEQAKVPEPKPPETPPTGPGMVDLGAATPANFPDAPSNFRHWWDQNFGKPASKIVPTIKALWNGHQVREGMAYLKDWVENSAKLFARSTANDIRQPLRRISKKDFLVADNALSMVVEAKGRPEALDEMRIKLIDSTKADPWWRKQALDALDYAVYHWDELNKLADDYKGITSTQVDVENVSNIPTLRREGYVPHRQEIDEMDLLTSSGQGQSTFFEKPRVHDTFADSIAAGRDPKSLSATDLLEHRLASGTRLVNSRKWMDTLRGWKDPTTGAPIATNLQPLKRADGSTVMVPPTGYVSEMVGPHSVAILKGYEGTFNALTDPSFFTKNMAGRAFMQANATGKSINLLFDSFHLGRMAYWASLIKSLGVTTFKMPFPSYRRGATLLDYSTPQIREMAANGEIPQKWLGTLLEDKRRLDLAIKSGYNVGRISDALYQDLIHNLPIAGKFNKWLFDQFQRGAMAESWLLEFERTRRASPKMSEEAIAREVTKDLNVRFGNLGRQGWFKSRTAQDAARILFLAPQWNEGLIKSELGAVREAGRFAMDAATGKRIFAGTLLRSVGAMALMQFAANQIINQATRGKFTWENEEEGWGSKLSAWVPDIAGNGPGFFLHPLGLAAETTHLLTNLFERSGGDTSKMILDYARSRSSAAMRPVLTLLMRTDFLGHHIKPDNLWGEVVKSAIPTPIAGKAVTAMGKQMVTGQPSEQYAGQFQKQAMQSMGIRTEGAPSPEQRINRLAQEWRREKGVPQNVAMLGVGDYQPLIQAVRIGNMVAAQAEIDRLREKHTDEDIKKHFRKWQKDAFSGSHAREREFRSGLTPVQDIAYIKARDDRERVASEVRGLLR